MTSGLIPCTDPDCGLTETLGRPPLPAHSHPAPIERCPNCDGPMERVWITDHEAWACPKDATAYAVDQDGLDDLYDDLGGDE